LSEAPAGRRGRAPARRAAAAQQAGGDPLARAVFALLLVACLAAFLVTQRLKHTPTAVQSFKLTPYFTPYPGGHPAKAAISFKLSHAEAVTVTLIDTAGDTVARLVRDLPVARYKTLSLRWDGRRGDARRLVRSRSPHGLPILEPVNEGRLAPPGEYRVRVALSHHSPVLSPHTCTLVAR